MCGAASEPGLSDQGRLRESSRSSGSFAIVRVEFPYDRPDRLDIREFKIPRRPRPRKRRLKSEFAFFQSLS